MRPTARLIVVEPVIPEEAAFHFGKWTDLQMLVCVEGRDRTETEYRALRSSAGFDLEQVVATDSLSEPPSCKANPMTETSVHSECLSGFRAASRCTK
jgi:O-methyltransferase domain